MWQDGLLLPSPRHLYLAFLPILSLPNLPTPCSPSPAPLQQTPVCDAPLPVSICSHCFIPLMSENMRCLIFCSWVSLLRMMVSRFIHVPTKNMNSSFFYVCIVFHGVYVPHFFVQSIIDGDLGWFQVFAIVNSTAMNIHVHVSL